ncbi:MAG TPA: hypothetical protein VMG63_12375 [Terriglobia bacterium]|nr:hypothetical protein [Terriglobia bacterium]
MGRCVFGGVGGVHLRKRSSAKIARVAARKLAQVCWKRLVRWQQRHPVETCGSLA